MTITVNRAALTLISLLCAITTPATVVAEIEALDKIIAIADANVILQSEYEERIASIKSNAKAQGQELPDDEALGKQVMERLIVESLQIQVAERAGLRVSDEELTQTLRTIADQNQLNLLDFQAALAEDGISWIDMRAQIRKEIIISRVQQGVVQSRIAVSDQEVDNFLSSEIGATLTADEFRMAHILLPVSDPNDQAEIESIRLKADGIFAQINAGEDFGKLAMEKSAGQRALEGGELGWRKLAQLPTLFAEVAQDMSGGEVRGPIQTGSGFHLMKMIEKRGAQAEGQVAQTAVRHVLVKPSEILTEEEARELAETLREEIIDGRSFEEVAKIHSDDPGSALSGGDLGWTRAGTFVDEFETLVQSSEIDDVSEVFKTEHGYHFLQVTGRRVEDFSDTFKRNQATNYIGGQKFDDELDQWIREIRSDAYIEIRI
jgi:peptidyl-prolyl cis-trans isomerase SurA